MNLYDKDDGFKKFTLEKVNALLPKVVVVTDKTLQRLRLNDSQINQVFPNIDLALADFDDNSKQILDEWGRQISALGAYPKGYFTVDFKSPIPDTLFCWTYGEQTVTHTHKIYETFKDRISIQRTPLIGFENMLN